MADLKDENLKGRLVELRQIRDSAQADAERAEARMRTGEAVITSERIQEFAQETRRRLRRDSGGYRRHHVQALAQRIDVTEKHIRISGTTVGLLKALVASGSSVNSAASAVRSFGPKWLPE
jgi:site-specific DNA recombinase